MRFAVETCSRACDEYAADLHGHHEHVGAAGFISKRAWANLLIDTMYHYRGSAYLLHEFVIMPDHLHVLLTPSTSLEKAVQFIKGGFSYRVKKELGSSLEIWQKGFSDHRIRDTSDYRIHAIYVRENPVRKHLCEGAKEYPFSSASGGFELDSPPQGLKPWRKATLSARLKARPFKARPPKATPPKATPPKVTPPQSTRLKARAAKATPPKATPPKARAPKARAPKAMAPKATPLVGMPSRHGFVRLQMQTPRLSPCNPH